MSFISLSVAAPSLHYERVSHVVWYELRKTHAPLEPRIVCHEFVKVRHELIDRLSHVHMPYVGPHRIRVR